MARRNDSIQAPNFLEKFESALVKRDVDITTFAHSAQFCNKPLYPRQRTLLKLIFLEELDAYDKKVIDEWEKSTKIGGETEISPKLRDRVDHLKDEGYPHFPQVVLVGGRRSSKGHITGCAIAKKVYDMVQIDNVGEHYGIDPDKQIYFSIVADSLDQAKAHQFGDAVNWILECRPLVEQGLINKVLAESLSVFTPYDKSKVLRMEAEQGRIDRDLAKIQIKAHGTNSRTLRGQASMAFIFDEFAHLISSRRVGNKTAESESRMSDSEIFKAAMPSLRQFGKDAIIFANSSPYTKIGKFYELYEQALKLDPPEDGNPVFWNMLMVGFPSWELYKDWDDDPIYKWSKAIVVDPIFDKELALEEEANPESFKVEYRGKFAEVQDAFLNPELVDRMFDPKFSRETIGRVLNTTYGAQGYVAYKGHGDPASTGANFGIAMGHIEDVMNQETEVMEPHVVFDLIHAFYPADFPNHTIDWLEVLPNIEDLINNFRPYEFTFDQFDSTAPIQMLTRNLANKGIFETQVYTRVATFAENRRRWMNFKSALNLGRIHSAHPTSPIPQPNERSLELGRAELKFLQDYNGRVDKQSIGPIQTKDIADCMCEVVDALIGNQISQQLLTGAEMQMGSPHGYSIGGRTTESPFDEFYAQKNLGLGLSVSRGGRFMRRRNSY